MSKESFPNDYPDYGIRNLDYFFGREADSKTRAEYLRRGLIPTNNLSVYFVDEPLAELAPGIPNTYDYRQKPFGATIQNFKQAHPDLWEAAKASAQETTSAMRQHTKALLEHTDATDLQMAADQASWNKAEIYDRVFRIIAPQLQAAGIDPLEVCKA